MRVGGGRLRGRRLVAPAGAEVRPTADKTRLAIFNIIAHGGLTEQPLEGARVLDVFAGTGALGIEALSRGARHATFIERDRRALASLRANLVGLGLEVASEVLALDATRLPPAHAPVHLAFLDPPYGEALGAPALEALAAGRWLVPGALVVLELGLDDPFEAPPGFAPLDERRYGAARVVFLRVLAS
jgi:16S rRNA (guanine966-N2)-methyltransferase